MWLPIEPIIAKINQGLIQGGITNNELSSDRAFKAFSISITTRTDKLRVLAFTFPLVKYSQGFLEKSNPSKLVTLKEPVGHEGHSLQLES